MADRLPGLALVQRLVQNIRRDQKGISKQERQSARLVVLLPEAQRLTEHAIAHGVRQDIDALQAGIFVGIGVSRISPLHEFLEHTGEGKGALVRRLLIVPIVFDESQIVIAGPDDGDHEQLPLLLLVAEGLKLFCIVEDILGKIREAVDVDEYLPILGLFDRRQKILAAELFNRAVLVSAAAEKSTARRIVTKIEDEVRIQFRLGVDRRHSTGDEEHGEVSLVNGDRHNLMRKLPSGSRR